MGDITSYGISEFETNFTDKLQIEYYDKKHFDTILNSNIPKLELSRIISTMCRVNILYMIANAGSGHIGTSFSSIDVITWLHLNILSKNDILFSSKGHDVPAFYSLLTVLGDLDFNFLHEFRKYNGLPGHPDVKIDGFFTNTGSLGMGISKAKGFLKAFDLKNDNKSRVYTVLGDGELQEGQNWESLINVKYVGTDRLFLIIDNNKVQSDKLTSETSDLGDLKLKFESFNCNVIECDGNSFEELNQVFSQGYNKKVNVIICNTVKGSGVDFMEHTKIKNSEFYKYHSGAPNKENYLKSLNILKDKIYLYKQKLSLSDFKTDIRIINKSINQDKQIKLISAYSNHIVNISSKNKNVIALNADLILDTGLIEFSETFPERFIECGIAEQDMVSQAGTLALSGFLPVVHSFSCFLTTRACEQIYNNQTQNSKVVYVGSLAGILPGGPGSSHQSVRDIALMSGYDNMVLIEPISDIQLGEVLNWTINKNSCSSYIRINSIPVKMNQIKSLPSIGCGEVLSEGNEVCIIVLGPILLNNVIEASTTYSKDSGRSIKIISTPWINRFDLSWYSENLKGISTIISVENHQVDGGFGDKIFSFFSQSDMHFDKYRKIGVHGELSSGENEKVLEHHELDTMSIYNLIVNV